MAVFSILSETPQPHLQERIAKLYAGKFYHFSDTISFIRDNGSAQELVKNLGIRSRDADGKVIGEFEKTAVIQTSPAYWGWSKSTLWEWLKTSFEATN